MNPQSETELMAQGAQLTRDFLMLLLKDPVSELGLLLRDETKFWRFKHQINMIERARRFLERKGIDPRSIKHSVLPETIMPIIAAAGDTGDPDLSGLFSGLLASAINPETAEMTHPSFAKILAQLSPVEAVILKRLYSEILSIKVKHAFGVSVPGFSNPVKAGGKPVSRQAVFDTKLLARSLEKSDKIISLCASNLTRLGLCDEGPEGFSGPMLHRLRFTEFGFLFVESCMPDGIEEFVATNVKIGVEVGVVEKVQPEGG